MLATLLHDPALSRSGPATATVARPPKASHSPRFRLPKFCAYHLAQSLCVRRDKGLKLPCHRTRTSLWNWTVSVTRVFVDGPAITDPSKGCTTVAIGGTVPSALRTTRATSWCWLVTPARALGRLTHGSTLAKIATRAVHRAALDLRVRACALPKCAELFVLRSITNHMQHVCGDA